METRILTLFDDDFFPPEPPKEKPKKEKAPKPSAANDSDETDAIKKDTDIIAEALNEFHQLESKEHVPAGKSVDEEIDANAIEKVPTTIENNIEMAADKALQNNESKTGSEPDINEIDLDYEITTSVDLDISDESTVDIEPFYDVHSAPVFEPAAVINSGAEDAYNQTIEDEASVAENYVEPDMASDESAAFISYEITTSVDLDISDEATSDVKGLNNETIDEPVFEEGTAIRIASIEEEENADEDDIITSMEEEMDVVDEPFDSKNEVHETLAEQPSSNEDRELDKQILSELIQLDYTALMQKDYAFDLNNATVINKELPKSKPHKDKIVAYKNEEEDDEEEEIFEDVAPLPEWKLDKKYYTIGEVAALFEVNTSHIRFWTNEFKLRPRTTRKGDRLYSPKDIAELRLIHHLVKVKKHTIKGAREKLKAEKTDVNNKLDLKESLVQLKDTLMKIREQL